MRILSTFAVILIHVDVSVANSGGISLVDFNFFSFVNVFMRFCVPCFVMISGAFVLSNEKNGNYKYFYTKSFYKIGIPFVIFSFLIVILAELSCIIEGSGFIDPIVSLLKGQIDNYWFMFMLVGLYFLAPIIINVKKSVSDKSYCIFSFIWIVFAVISQISTSYSVSYSFGIVFSFLGYFLIGNVIYEHLPKKGHGLIYILLSLICFLSVFVFRGVTKYSKFSVDAFSSWFSPMILIACVLLFLGFSNINIKANLKELSGNTYVIYLVHTKIYLLIMGVLDKFIPSFRNYTEIYVLVVTVFAFIISLICAKIYNWVWKYFEQKYKWKEKFFEKLIKRNVR